MKEINKKEFLRIVEQSIKKIKSSDDNPYKELKFVDAIFESSNKHIVNIKNILKGEFKGNLQENLFKNNGDTTKAQHLYNYLYEHNLLSKYTEVADYMNFPPATELKKKI